MHNKFHVVEQAFEPGHKLSIKLSRKAALAQGGFFAF